MYIPINLIPIEPGGCHIMMQAGINGCKANVLIDTGASRTIMDVKRVKYYLKNSEIKPFGKQLMGVGAEKMSTWVASIEEIRFGEIMLNNVQVILTDMKTINASYAIYDLPRIDMVLGGDLLLRLRAVIDYEKKALKINKINE